MRIAAPPPRLPKKRGAPKGHPGWFRPKPPHVDHDVEVMLGVILFDGMSTKLFEGNKVASMGLGAYIMTPLRQDI